LSETACQPPAANRPARLLARPWELVLGIFDSPTLARDLWSLLSAWRVGFWFLVLNTALLVLLGFAVLLSSVESIGPAIGPAAVSQHLGLGQFLTVLLLAGLAGLLTLLIPIRASGIFEAPRWGRYFDQLVLAGIRPERYFAGKILAMNVFFLMVMLAATPYAIFCLSLEGSRFGFFAWGVVTLWLYANLLTLCTLAASAYLHEIATVIAMLFAFGLLNSLALAPLPPFLGLLTPIPFLLEPIYAAAEAVAGSAGLYTPDIVLDIGDYTFLCGRLGFFLLGALSGSLLALLALLLGPIHCLLRENSTFGEIIMKGDSSRKKLLRRYYTLRRRAELAFFYENRHPWLIRWELPIRYGGLLLPLTAAILLAYAILHTHSTGLDPRPFHALNLAIFVVVLLAGIALFSCDKSVEITPLRAGPYTNTAGALDTACFFLIVAIATLCALGLPVLHTVLAGDPWWYGMDWNGAQDWEHLFRAERLTRLYPLILAMAAEAYALTRVLAMLTWSRAGGVLLALFLLATLWVFPYAAAVGGLELATEYDFAEPLIWLSAISPIPHMIHHMDPAPRGEARTLLLSGLHHLTLSLHLMLAALFGKLALYLRRCLRERQAFEIEALAAEEEAEAEDDATAEETP